MNMDFLKSYLDSNDDFLGWEDVEIYAEDTLSEAWISARENDKYKFEDYEFKAYVNGANGKWLEKQSEDDTYKIILSTKGRTDLEIMSTAIHELRHVLDYKNGVKDLHFDEYFVGTRFFINYSEFKAVREQTIFELKYVSKGNPSFDYMAQKLGLGAADAVHGIMRNNKDINAIKYYISRYLGVHKGVNFFNDGISPVFHLWTLTPCFIIEHFGHVFYLGQEWEDMPCCSIKDEGNHYYRDLERRIEEYADTK